MVRGAAAGKAPASSVVAGNGNWDGVGGMDQITVVRIDDSHIAGEQSHGEGKGKDGGGEFYEVEYSLPAEEVVVGEEEEDGVYVIEYSNPEEEGESYQFTMSVDRPLPPKKPVRLPVAREDARAPLPVIARASRQRDEGRQMRKMMAEEEEEQAREEEVVSNKSVLEFGEDYGDMLGSGRRQLVCVLCPPPGRLFKRASGLAVHLKQMHLRQGKKTFFCTSCNQSVRSQIELDTHTRRHANQDAVFTCFLCSAAAAAENQAEVQTSGYRGSKMGLKKHLEKEHPGVIPRCHICNKGFKTLASYLADQFRHVGVSPYYCAKCQIYEMTERGLSVHNKNHSKKKKRQEGQEKVPTTADNSATDDSDF